MARVKIVIPSHQLFDCNIGVRISDINYGNHLGNDSLVSILQEARMLWLQSLQYTELSIEGVGLIMSDLAVMYKNESFYGDVLNIKLYLGETSAVSFELVYEINNQQHSLIAIAKTGMVCYNYELKKVSSLPEFFLKKIQLDG
ncbi:MAG: thioesterase family protein [Ferruginibacter sp.]